MADLEPYQMSEVHDQIARLADGVTKLTGEIQRLRRDIASLHARIEPFEGEVRQAMPLEEPTAPRTRSLMDELARLQLARGTIESCERHLNAMRAKVDEIANDSLSREEMKPWLGPAGRQAK